MAGTKKRVFKYSLQGCFLQGFDSITDAAKSVSLTHESISLCIKTRSTSGGFIWLNKRDDLKARILSECIRMQSEIENYEGEEWRDIEGYEGMYQISSKGRVKAITRFAKSNNCSKQQVIGRLKKPCLIGNGYFAFNLYKDGSNNMKYAHRLVANAFIDNPNNMPCVNHKDENKKNNDVSNLEWCTPSYNVNYGTCKQRISDSHKKLLKGKKIVQIDKCGKNIIAYYPNSSIAMQETGIDASAINKVCLGRPKFKTAGGYVWRYVDSTAKTAT